MNKQSTDNKTNENMKSQNQIDTKNDQLHKQGSDGEEKQIGLFQTASTRTYLEQTVSEVIMQGMSELARVRPDNPLEYLGNFILSKAKSNK
jgi:hypothetical protein